jgi:hypothetical protein
MKLKLVFYIEEADAEGNFHPEHKIAVEKSQIVFDVLSDQELVARMQQQRDESDKLRADSPETLPRAFPKGPMPLQFSALARDHNAERMAAFEPYRQATGPMPDGLRDVLKEIQGSLKWNEEALIAAGDLLQRHVKLKLREWARQKLKEKEPA